MNYNEGTYEVTEGPAALALGSIAWISPCEYSTLEPVVTDLQIGSAHLLKLHELTSRLLTSSDLTPLLYEILSAVTHLQGTDMGTLHLCDSQKPELNMAVSVGLPESVTCFFKAIPIGVGPCGIAVKTGKRVVVEDVATDDRTTLLRKAGGAAFCKSVYSTPLVTHSGKVIGSMANLFPTKHTPSPAEMLLVDLYARHAAEFIDNARLSAEADRTQKALLHKTEELEHFVHSVAHDLKEPLRTMAVFTELLKRANQSLDTDSQKYMSFVSDGAKRMTGLIDDLVAYARLERHSLALNLVDTSVMVQRVLASLRVAIHEEEAEVTCGELPHVLAEEETLSLVFQNLISNAIKFHKKRVRPKVQISAQKTSEGWCFSLRDNGIGINPRDQASLFQIFKRLNPKSEFPGSGIGLASCKKIVERHGGRIWVESDRGEGTEIKFVIGTATS